MHKTVSEATTLAEQLVARLAGETRKIMIAPPFIALADVNRVLSGSNILLGAQNVGQEEQGAHTGEISVLMLNELGVSVIILGHSERRHVYGENDDLINKKLRLALNHDFEVILCVGETLEQRENGVTTSIIEQQLKKGLEGVARDRVPKVTIAYEPVWAIGTGKTATPKDADEVHQFIRNCISTIFSREIADEMIIQYGGSVKPSNASELMGMPNIDGALVGGAALQEESFTAIVQYGE